MFGFNTYEEYNSVFPQNGCRQRRKVVTEMAIIKVKAYRWPGRWDA